MPTRDELASALRKADAAGEAADAKRLADAIRAMDAAPAADGRVTNPMVAQGQAAQQEWRNAGSKPANPNPENPIITAQRNSQAQANSAFHEERRPRTDAELAAVKAAKSAAFSRAVGEMGFAPDVMPTQSFDDQGNVTSMGELDKALPWRFGASAVNAAGPGSANAILEIGDAAFGPGLPFDYAGNELDFSKKPQPRITFGGDGRPEVPKPPRMLPTVPLTPARDAAEMAADFGGTLFGALAGPGKAVPKEAGLGKVASQIGAKGTPVAKGLGFGTRTAGNIIENVGYAGVIGANMAPDGQRAETAAQFMADPLTWAVGPGASLIYRGSIALKTMGRRVTPEYVRLQQAMQTLQSGKASPQQMQEAARAVDELTPPDPQAATGAPPEAPQSASGPAVPPSPQAGAPPPPVQPPAVVRPGPARPPAAPQPAPVAPVPTPTGSLGEAEVWFNSLDMKTRESILRTFESSNVKNKADQFAIIRDLNALPPGRNSQNAFLIAQKWGERYPSLRENLANMGGGFAVTNPRAPDQKILGFGGKADEAQSIMDTQGRKQVVSERGFLERSAEANFGKPSPEVAAELKADLTGLGNRYNALLDPTKKRRFGPAKTAQLEQADNDLRAYLKQPHVAQDMPEFVKNRIMASASEEMRNLEFTPDEIALITAGDGTVLAPLFSRTAPLQWSPKLWSHLVEQYPKVAGHFLQSAYGRAIGDAASSMSPDMKSLVPLLERARGFSSADGQGEGLLHLLEQTMPNKNFSTSGAGSYQDTRLNYGDVKGAQEALKITERFKAAAQNGDSLAEIVDELAPLSPRQKDAAFSQITSFVNDSMGSKVRNVSPDQVGMNVENAPNLTQLGNDNFLRGLRKVFGERGDALANDIELARASTTWNTDINRRINSRTEINGENVRNSPRIYEDPKGADGGIIDKGVQSLGGGAVGAAFFPGGQGAALAFAGMAGAKAAWNAYKKGKRLTNTQRNQLADFFFRSREAGVDGEAMLNGAPMPPPARGPSPVGFGANVAVGAGVGGAAGYSTSGGDPNAAVMGALGGAGLGAARARQRYNRNQRSLIKPARPPGPPTATPPRPPVKAGPDGTKLNGMGGTPEGVGAAGGATLGYFANPTDANGDGVIDDADRGLNAMGGLISGGLGVKAARMGIGAAKSGANALRDIGKAPELPKSAPKPPAPVRAREAIATPLPDPNAPRVKAYHGTQHDLTGFDGKKIGTGQGAQTFGYGHYFAENPAVAQTYRGDGPALVKQDGARPSWTNPRDVAGIYLAKANGNAEEATAELARKVRQLQQSVSLNKSPHLRSTLSDYISAQAALMDGQASKVSYNRGNLYEVDLRVSPDEMFDLDKPFSQQPPFVQEALRKVEADLGWHGSGTRSAATSPYRSRDYVPEAPNDYAIRPNETGHDIMSRLGHDSPDAAEYLREAGIKGLRYLDQKSRDAGTGTSNFVILRDDVIDVVGKNGEPFGVGRSELELTQRAAPPKPTQAGFGGSGGKGGGAKPPANALAGPPKRPKSEMRDSVGRAVAGGVIGGAFGSAAGAEPQDNEQQLKMLNDRIAQLEADQMFFRDASAEEIQQRLTKEGFDLGKYGADGKIGKDTAAAIKGLKAQIEKDLSDNRARRKDVETQIAFEKTRPNDAQQILREAAPYLGAAAGIFFGGRSRVGAVKKAAVGAQADIARADRLLTPGPINAGRGATARAAVKGQPANINEFWRMGGAGENVPFEVSTKGDWRARPKAMPPSKLFPEKTPRLRAGDYAVIASALGEAGISTVGIDMVQKELEAAQAAADKNPTEANLQRVEQARDMLGVLTAAQRLGLFFAGGRALSAWKKPYQSARPNIAEAEAERARLLEYFQRLKK